MKGCLEFCEYIIMYAVVRAILVGVFRNNRNRHIADILFSSNEFHA